jgi:FkbM family methyltransferase
MLSYAQNAEDVVLRRVFLDRVTGFYVDIGACDPVEDSVTKHFYDHGWRGVNVEPDSRFHAALAADRPRDVNLRAAIGRGETPLIFYPTGTRGHGTLDAARAAGLNAAEPEMVSQMTLARILAEQAPAEGVEFLKVDVEGWEEEVLASADWSKVRPRVVVVEAVDPDGRPSHERWEGILLAADYKFGLFDGLNRFYCREEDAETLLPRLAAPGNVLDNWRLARELRAQADAVAGRQAEVERMSAALVEQNTTLVAQHTALIAEHTAHAMTRTALSAEETAHAASRGSLIAEHAAHAATRDLLASEQAAHGATRDLLASEQAAHGATRDLLASEQAAHAATRDAVAAERAAHAATRDTLAAERIALGEQRRLLAAVHASTSWRITAPLRDSMRLVRLVRPGG